MDEEFVLMRIIVEVVIRSLAGNVRCAAVAVGLSLKRVRTGRGTGILVHKQVMNKAWEQLSSPRNRIFGELLRTRSRTMRNTK